MKRKSLAARIRNYSLALGSGFRSKRITPLLDMIMRVTRENGRCSIIDIGGTREYWSIIPKDFLVNNCVSVTVVNVAPAPSIHASEEWFTYVHGDGCNLQHLDKSFDIAHSNSVIEHVGTWDSMVKFSKEIDRVSFGYFVQTPNYWFPWEPHFGTPCFQFLPVPLKVSLLMAGERGFFDRMPTIDAAMRAIESCELLDERRFRSLFPDAEIQKERFLGMNKSFVAIKQP